MSSLAVAGEGSAAAAPDASAVSEGSSAAAPDASAVSEGSAAAAPDASAAPECPLLLPVVCLGGSPGRPGAVTVPFFVEFEGGRAAPRFFFGPHARHLTYSDGRRTLPRAPRRATPLRSWAALG